MSDAILKEKVEVLNRERGERANAAVRLSEVRAMVNAVPGQPKAKTLTAAPTMDDFNALLEDVRRVYEAMNAIRVLVK